MVHLLTIAVFIALVVLAKRHLRYGWFKRETQGLRLMAGVYIGPYGIAFGLDSKSNYWVIRTFHCLGAPWFVRNATPKTSKVHRIS